MNPCQLQHSYLPSGLVELGYHMNYAMMNILSNTSNFQTIFISQYNLLQGVSNQNTDSPNLFLAKYAEMPQGAFQIS